MCWPWRVTTPWMVLLDESISNSWEMRGKGRGEEYMGTVLDDGEIGIVANGLLHVFFVQITIHLRTRTVHLENEGLLLGVTAGPREAFSTRNWMPP